jgi:hypothetical protein
MLVADEDFRVGERASEDENSTAVFVASQGAFLSVSLQAQRKG